MPQYVRERSIFLYSKLIDKPDIPQEVRGIPDEATLQNVSVVILRPSGDRFDTLVPALEMIPGFGTWYVAILNLDFTAELGEWKIRWVYKTSTGDVISEYSIDIVSSVLTPYWCFQRAPEHDDSLPDDVKEMMNDVV